MRRRHLARQERNTRRCREQQYLWIFSMNHASRNEGYKVKISYHINQTLRKPKILDAILVSPVTDVHGKVNIKMK